jgi:vacuolar-type H+-ATPase subunit H
VEPSVRTDDAVKTLALAQRTADLAIHEAKTEAERLVRTAEQKARRTISSAEESAVQIAEQAQEELRADLERLQHVRDQLVGDVKALGSWLDNERGRLKRALAEVADRIDHVRDSGDAPAPKSVKVPAAPKEKLAKKRAAASAPPAAPVEEAPAPPEPERPAPPVERPKANVTPPVAAPLANPKHTPPKGQPAVQAPRPVPEPEPAPVAASGDAAVLNRAQEAVTANHDDDPFFAELRAAMMDQSPLGPRDDDEAAG